MEATIGNRITLDGRTCVVYGIVTDDCKRETLTLVLLTTRSGNTAAMPGDIARTRPAAKCRECRNMEFQRTKSHPYCMVSSFGLSSVTPNMPLGRREEEQKSAEHVTSQLGAGQVRKVGRMLLELSAQRSTLWAFFGRGKVVEQ